MGTQKIKSFWNNGLYTSFGDGQELVLSYLGKYTHSLTSGSTIRMPGFWLIAGHVKYQRTAVIRWWCSKFPLVYFMALGYWIQEMRHFTNYLVRKWWSTHLFIRFSDTSFDASPKSWRFYQPQVLATLCCSACEAETKRLIIVAAMVSPHTAHLANAGDKACWFAGGGYSAIRKLPSHIEVLAIAVPHCGTTQILATQGHSQVSTCPIFQAYLEDRYKCVVSNTLAWNNKINESVKYPMVKP